MLTASNINHKSNPHLDRDLSDLGLEGCQHCHRQPFKKRLLGNSEETKDSDGCWVFPSIQSLLFLSSFFFFPPEQPFNDSRSAEQKHTGPRTRPGPDTFGMKQ